MENQTELSIPNYNYIFDLDTSDGPIFKYIDTPSGHTLSCWVDENTVSIADSENISQSLAANVRSYAGINVLNYSFNPYGEDYDSQKPSIDKNITNRHPDLFAGKFAEKAFAFFLKNKTIHAISGDWSAWSDNFVAFKQEYELSKNPTKAALATWTGKLASKLGYDQITDQDIWFDLDQSKTAVLTLFYPKEYANLVEQRKQFLQLLISERE